MQSRGANQSFSNASSPSPATTTFKDSNNNSNILLACNHVTVYDDLSLMSEKERSVFILLETAASSIVLLSSIFAVYALLKTRRRNFTTPNLLMCCLSSSDICSSALNLVLNVTLMYNGYSTCKQSIRIIITVLFMFSQIGYALMVLSGVNRFLRIRLLLHYDSIITIQAGKRVIMLGIGAGALIAGMAEIGHAMMSKFGRFVVASAIDIPSLVLVLSLYCISLRDLKRMNAQVRGLPAKIRTMVKLSSVHLVAVSLAIFPFVACFFVRRTQVLEPRGMARMFFWCMFLFKSATLLNVYNVFCFNKRCRHIFVMTQ